MKLGNSGIKLTNLKEQKAVFLPNKHIGGFSVAGNFCLKGTAFLSR